MSSDDEQNASQQTREQIDALRARRETKSTRPVPFDLDAEAERRRVAKARAFAGVAGKDYFPKSPCVVCGAIMWLDSDRDRYQLDHDAEKHGLSTTAQTKRSSDAHAFTQPNLSVLAAQQRARRAAGERDDE